MLAGLLLHTYPAEGPLKTAYLSWVLISLPFSVSIYFAVLGCVYAFSNFVEARTREAQALRLTTQLAEAQLSAPGNVKATTTPRRTSQHFSRPSSVSLKDNGGCGVRFDANENRQLSIWASYPTPDTIPGVSSANVTLPDYGRVPCHSGIIATVAKMKEALDWLDRYLGPVK